MRADHGRRARRADPHVLELDRWLDEQLDDARRAELAARGKAMDPREIQTLTQAVAARHLELP